VHFPPQKQGQNHEAAETLIAQKHVPTPQVPEHLWPIGQLPSVPAGADGVHQQAGAGVEQNPPMGHGKAAAGFLLRRLAELFLQGRRVGHGEARAVDVERAMATPQAVGMGVGGAGRLEELLQQRWVDRQRQAGVGLAPGRGAEVLVGEVADLAAGGVAMDDLLDEQADGGGRIQFPLAPVIAKAVAGAGDEVGIKSPGRAVAGWRRSPAIPLRSAASRRFHSRRPETRPGALDVGRLSRLMTAIHS